MQPFFTFTVDEKDPMPLYQQLYSGLKQTILTGKVLPGERIPGVAHICHELNLSIGTVTRALKEIEREGLITSRRGAGIFVAPRVHALEVLVPFLPIDTVGPEGVLDTTQQFAVQFMHGLREPLLNTQYRLSLTYLSGPPPAADEILSICNARRAIGLIEYWASPKLVGELKKVARHIPIISLGRDPRSKSLGFVCCDPASALRTLVARRQRKNPVKTVFIARDADVHQPNVYRKIVEALGEDDRRSPGIPTFLGDGTTEETAAAGIEKLQLCPGDLVVTTTTHMALGLSAALPGLDLIAYTENSASVKMYQKKISFLYLGIDRIAAEGIRLLLTHQQDATVQLPLRRWLEPEILEKK